jgi:hypothetical protein
VIDPTPLEAQSYPYAVSEIPTPVPVVIHVNYDDLVEQVVPAAGSTLSVRWEDMGKRLVEVGAIDLEKVEHQYGELNAERQEILWGNTLQEISFTRENIQFWTNVLWSLGLTQHSKVLSDGPI